MQNRGMRKPIGRLIAATSVIAAAGLIACSSAAPSTPSTPSTNTATLAPQARAVQSLPTSVSSSTVTFPDNAETAGLQVGHVIASATRTDHPYLGRITSIQRSGGKVSVQLGKASLVDLFQDLHWSQKIMMGDAANTSDGTQSLRPGGVHLDDGLTGPGVAATKTWDLGDDGSEGSIDANGACNLDWSESYLTVGTGIEFSIDYSLADGLTAFKLAAVGDVTAHIGAVLKAQASVDYTSPDVEWVPEVLLGVFWFQAGPVPIPVAVTVKVTANVAIEVGGEFDMHAGATLSASIEEGVQYSNGQMSLVNNPQYGVTWNPPSVTEADVSVDVTEYPMNFVFAMKLLDAAGPTIEFDPFEKITAKVGTNGAEVNGSFGIECEVGGEVEILDVNLGEFKYPVAEWDSPDFPIWSSSTDGGVGDGGILSGDGGGYYYQQDGGSGYYGYYGDSGYYGYYGDSGYYGYYGDSGYYGYYGDAGCGYGCYYADGGVYYTDAGSGYGYYADGGSGSSGGYYSNPPGSGSGSTGGYYSNPPGSGSGSTGGYYSTPPGSGGGSTGGGYYSTPPSSGGGSTGGGYYSTPPSSGSGASGYHRRHHAHG